MKFRHPIKCIEDKFSKADMLQDFYAVCVNEGRVGNFLEIGGSERNVGLLEDLGWKGYTISHKLDKNIKSSTKIIHSNPLEINLKTIFQLYSNYIKHHQYNALFINFDSDLETIGFLSNLKKTNFLYPENGGQYMFSSACIRSYGVDNTHRKIMNESGMVSIAIDVTKNNVKYDWYVDPDGLDFATFCKFAYDKVSPEELIYDYDLSHITKRCDVWSQDKNVDYWSKYFLNYD